ncbi:MAG: TonB-dependent receptor [Gemmatimonadota bacterium]|nr:TonB-dependent receptor [Gemmatimonadota bacterium]
MKPFAIRNGGWACAAHLPTTLALVLVVAASVFVAPATAQDREQPGGTLIGTVTSEGGQPLGQADVHVPALGRQALTDARGSFRMTNVQPRTVRVRFDRIGYESAVREVTVSAGEVTRVEVTMQTRPIEREEIVVTGTPSAANPMETTQDVDAVAAPELARSRSASLGKVLEEQVPGVANISTGSQAGKPVLRGLSGTRVRTLQNGIAQDFFQYGVRHATPTSLAQVERVEVVRGASSILYGSDALGGAVNMITKDLPSAPEGQTRIGGDVEGQFFSNNEERAGLVDLHAAGDRFGARAGVEVRKGDDLKTPEAPTFFRDDPRTGVGGDPKYAGEVPFTNFEQWSVYGQAGLRGDFGKAELFMNHWSNRQNFLLPMGGPVGSEDNPPVGLGQELGQTNVALSGNLASGGVVLKPTLSFQRATRQAATPGATFEADPDFPVDLAKNSYTARFELLHPTVASLDGTLGAEVNYQDTEQRGPVELEPSSEILNAAVFAFEELGLGDLTLSAGVRLDVRDQEAVPNDRTTDPELLESTFTEVSGGLGFNYELVDGLALAGNANSGFRAPAIFELYANGVHGGVAAFQRGSPELDSERSFSGDLALRARTGRVSGKVTGYVNQIQDFVFLENTGERRESDGLPIFSSGQTDATIRGVEGNVEVSTFGGIDVGGSFSFLDHEGDGLSDPEGGDEDGPLPLIPADRLSGFVRATASALGPLSSPRLRFDVRHGFSKDAAGRIEPFSQFDDLPFGTASTDAYTLFDVEGSATLEMGEVPVSLSLAVENLSDEVYRQFLDTYKGYALSPGRNVKLTVSAPFHVLR